MKKSYDFLMIGCGMRGIHFLAKNPWLLERDMGLVEGSPELGLGNIPWYQTVSHSSASDLLAYFSNSELFSKAFSAQEAKLAENRALVMLTKLRPALRRAGKILHEKLGDSNTLTRTWAQRIDVDQRSEYAFSVYLSNGRKIQTKRLILATGMHETLHSSLRSFEGPIILSGALLDCRNNPETLSLLNKLDPQRICVAGGSHSALSSVSLLLDLLNRITPNQSRYQEIILAHRSPVRLRYSSLEEAVEEFVLGREKRPSENFVCPRTGTVFRQTGLKGPSRQLYLDIYAKQIANVRTMKITSIKSLLKSQYKPDLIIQALGYKATVPPIFIRESSSHHFKKYSRLQLSPIGTDNNIPGLYTVRMQRTSGGDTRSDPRDQYFVLGEHIQHEVNGVSKATNS